MDTDNICDWCRAETSTANSIDELHRTFLEGLAQLDVSDVSYLSFNIHGRCSAVTSYPAEWRSLYMEEGLYKSDPVISRATNSTVAEVWCADDDRGECRDFFELATEFGVPRRGAVVGYRNRFGATTIMSFASQANPRDWSSRCRETLPVFHMLSQAFIMTLDRIEAERAPHLSLREREVLIWAMRGKTAVETGMILHLSTGTVNQYIHSAIRKLGTTGKLSCVVSAMERGLLTTDEILNEALLASQK